MPRMEPSATENPLQELLRKLPSVDHLLNQPAVASLLGDYPRSELVHVVRAVLEDHRRQLRDGQPAGIDLPALALQIRQQLYQRAHPSLRKVINATGIVLHTGLGRAPLAEAAVAAMAEVAAGYCNLELDLESGRRGDRHDHLRDLLRELCGAEDGLVVNNNAGATYLVLSALAADRQVIISRGQLVEIGGSYRLPEIMAASGCRMVEVGTTNRTRISDYERAINESTSVLLRVHTSNYRIVGFTESVGLRELVELGRRHGLLVVDDLGSGLLRQDLLPPGPAETSGETAAGPSDQKLPFGFDTGDEPTVLESIAEGADLALFSGDKLLGGPQAGIIVGRANLIASLRESPLARALRPDKLTLAALEATLRLYRDPDAVVRQIPAFRMLARSGEELRQAADRLAVELARTLPQAHVRTRPDYSEAGGGSLAAVPFPTWVVELRPAHLPAEAVAEGLRRRDLPIICRVQEGHLVFDPRTLEAEDAEQVPGAVAEVIRELEGA
jgi:L-seryl-tRNA(Ser) seleniumtransferase